MVEIEPALTKGLAWLAAQQAADGGWHSKTYGQLKDGAAVTALALDALSLGAKGKPAAAIDRGLAFLARGLAKRGAIASPDGSLDFPTYAAAFWLEATQRIARSEERAKVVEYLVGAQVAEPRGFEGDSPSYGGWDFLGPRDALGITTGTNISITAYVVAALKGDIDWRRAAGGSHSLTEIKGILKALELAKAYALRCQQSDGGFAFTCEPSSLNNKAAFLDEKLTQPRAYGTATCDGIRALIACGLKIIDEPIAKALAWLVKRPALEVVPGFETLPPEAGWQRGLRFYYYASLARVLAHLAASDRAARRDALVKHVLSLQRQDGSWQNESDRMRENDPLIATSLAIVALALAASVE